MDSLLAVIGKLGSRYFQTQIASCFDKSLWRRVKLEYRQETREVDWHASQVPRGCLTQISLGSETYSYLGIFLNSNIYIKIRKSNLIAHISLDRQCDIYAKSSREIIVAIAERKGAVEVDQRQFLVATCPDIHFVLAGKAAAADAAVFPSYLLNSD